MKGKFFIGLGVLVSVITSCKSDVVFDQGDYDNLIKNSFVVDNVDRRHTWASTGVVNLSATVDVDGAAYQDIFSVLVFEQNPLTRNKVTLLTSGEVRNGETFNSPVTYKLSESEIFIALVDATGGMSVYPQTLNGKDIVTTIGNKTPTVKAPSSENTSQFCMTYCFEDNFPDACDYDFNDVVLTVIPSVKDKTLTLKVLLEAIGTQKCIAAAIRIVGVKHSDLTRNPVAVNSFSSPDHQGLGEYNNIDTEDTFLYEDVSPNNTKDVVVVLFKDAHWAMNPQKADNGGVDRSYYNTVRRDQDGSLKAYTTAAEATYTFSFKSDEKARSLLDHSIYDVFIVESYNGSYWEVHTVPYKTAQVITTIKPDGYSAAYGSNMPWAIAVPASTSSKFKYPIEGQVIGEKRGSTLSGAYKTSEHSFGEWAENRKTALDWYNYPTSGLVFSY